MAQRLNITLAVKRLVRDVAARVPELAQVRASRLLVVAGEARRGSRATIRPARFAPPGRPPSFVRLRGREIRYVVTLRPLWFLGSSPEERVATILHELYHASEDFDGSLHPGRSHRRVSRARFDEAVRRLRDAYLTRAPHDVLAPFAHEGTVKVRMWLRGPDAVRASQHDVEDHLFYGLMPMRARPSRKRGTAGALAGGTVRGGGRGGVAPGARSSPLHGAPAAAHRRAQEER